MTTARALSLPLVFALGCAAVECTKKKAEQDSAAKAVVAPAVQGLNSARYSR